MWMSLTCSARPSKIVKILQLWSVVHIGAQTFYWRFNWIFPKFMYDSKIWRSMVTNSLALWVLQVMLKWELPGITMVGMQSPWHKLHRGVFCQFPFCHTSKSTGKETGKTLLCALCWICLGRSCFGLETINISTHRCYPINVDEYPGFQPKTTPA